MTINNTTIPTSLDALSVGRTSSNPFVIVFENRNPGVTDIQYPIQKMWLNTTTNEVFLLKNFTTSAGIISANWIHFAGDSIVETLTGDTGGPVFPNASSNINTLGTANEITVTGSPGTNTLTWSLTNGVAASSFGMQTGVATVVPTSAGLVTFNGATVANGTHPVRTDGTGVNTMALEVQLSDDIASTDATKVGLAAFSSAQFTVDGNGWVQLVGGTGPALQKINVDAHTGPGTDPVVPDATGLVTMTGAQVATGIIGANVIRTDSLVANTMTIEIQQATTSAAKDTTLNGVAHFKTSDFTVSEGFVSLTGSAGFDWNIVSTNQSMAVNNGYICVSPGGALTMALPSTVSSTLGDIIEVVLDGATSFQLTQAAGQQIRFSGSQTTIGVGGSITTTGTGDSIKLVYQQTGKWNCTSSNGNLTVA